VGVASYPLHRLYRLALIGIAAGLVNLEMASNYLANGDKANITLMAGLIASNVFRIFGYSSNLFWPFTTNEWNKIGCVVWVGLSLHLMIKKEFHALQAPNEPLKHTKNWLFAAMGLGSTLFGVHSMLSESSTILRWATEGFPNVGPEPLPWAALVLCTMCLGHGLSVSISKETANSSMWWLAGTVAVYTLYYMRGFLGFLGGLLFVVYLMTVIPTVFGNLSAVPIGRTMLLGSFLYLVQVLAHMWVVAYAFVPAGEYLRESTHIVLGMLMGGLFFGVVQNSDPVTQKTVPAVGFKKLYALLFAFACVGSYGVFWRMQHRLPPVPHSDKVITAGIWNVHYAYDNYAYFCEDRVSALLDDLQLDIVGK
jgi:hypothetical protein